MKKLGLCVVIGFFIAISCSKNDDSVSPTNDNQEDSSDIDRGNSAEDTVIIESFSDNFEKDAIKSFWSTEVAEDSRAKVIKDPLNSENKVLRIQCLPGDEVAYGHRSEVKIPSTKNKKGTTVKYSFKFMLPDLFFKPTEKSFAIIQQWHDQPVPGGSWADYPSRHPPMNLYVKTNIDPTKYQLVLTMGLWGDFKGGEIKENQSFKWSNNLKPNKWYSFKGVIKWGMENEKSYIQAKVNGSNIIKTDSGDKFKTRNMFNDTGNYFKMGIYSNPINDKKLIVYYDDFDYQVFKEKN